MGERVPQHVQNLVIRDYCEHTGLHFLLSATEYAMPNCHLMLEKILSELAEIDGLVAYSMFQLPENGMHRQRIYDQVLSGQKSFYFAVEGFKANTWEACQRVETLWQIRLTLPYCVELNLSALKV